MINAPEPIKVVIPLPSLLWVRAPNHPSMALCLDPNDRFYGWKMNTVNNRWVSSSQITKDETLWLLSQEYLKHLHDRVRPLLEKL